MLQLLSHSSSSVFVFLWSSHLFETVFVASSLEGRSHCLPVFPPCLLAFLGEPLCLRHCCPSSVWHEQGGYVHLLLAEENHTWNCDGPRSDWHERLGSQSFPSNNSCMTEVVFISTVGKLYFFDKQLFYLKLKRIPFYTMIHHLELKVFFISLSFSD